MTLANHPDLVAQADTFLIWPGVGASVGLGLFIRGFRLMQQKRLRQSTSISPIVSAAPGSVEISGLAVGPYTLTAPLTGKPCYYYRTIAWALQKSGKGENWEKVADESFHVPFYIDDSTGKLLVNPENAELDVHRDFHEEYTDPAKEEMPAGVIAFLGRHGISAAHQIRLEELSIQPKSALFISGTLAENRAPSISPKAVQTAPAEATSNAVPRSGNSQKAEPIASRSAAGIAMRSMSIEFEPHPERESERNQETIYLSPQAASTSSSEMTQQGKIAAALLKAGINRPSWATSGGNSSATAARPTAVRVSAVDMDLLKEFDLKPKLVLHKGESDSPFLISRQTQPQVVSSIGWASFAYVWAGPTLLLLSVYAILARLGWL